MDSFNFYVVISPLNNQLFVAVLTKDAAEYWTFVFVLPPLLKIVTPVPAETVIWPAPAWYNNIWEPVGNAIEEFGGTIKVIAEPLANSINLFLSLKASV